MFLIASLTISCSNMKSDVNEENDRLVGGSTITTNARISILVLDEYGEPADSVKVTLIPSDYNSTLSNADTLVRIARKVDGYYSIDEVIPGEYNIYATSLINNTGALIFEIYADSNSEDIVDTLSLSAPQKLTIQLPDSLYEFSGYVYIVGTTFKVPIVPGMQAITFETLAVGEYSKIIIQNDKDSNTVIEYNDVEIIENQPTVLSRYVDWNSEYKLKINLDKLVSDSDELLVNFPFLIQLSAANFDFSKSTIDGTDLRLTNEKGFEIPYEIENWNQNNGQANIWILLDSIDLNASIKTLSMYAGNDNSDAISNGNSVFSRDSNYTSVWHFNEVDGTQNSVGDSLLANPINCFSSVGIVGNALDLPNLSRMELPSKIFDSIDDQVEISFWQYSNPETTIIGNRILVGINISSDLEYRIHLPWSDSSVIWDAGFEDSVVYDRLKVPVKDDSTMYEGQWNHWSFTKDVSEGVMKAYLNGELLQSDSANVNTLESIKSFSLGSTHPDTLGYFGLIDEFRASRLIHSDEWIRASYENQSDNQNSLSIERVR